MDLGGDAGMGAAESGAAGARGTPPHTSAPTLHASPAAGGILLRILARHGSERRCTFQRSAPLRVLINACSRSCGLEPSEVRITVQGVLVAPNDTAASLGLVDGAILEVMRVVREASVD